MEQRIEETTLRDGTRVSYAVCGRGPILICVPGWVSHLELGWATPSERGFFETLAHDRTVIRYDLPGCGVSGPPRSKYSLLFELQTLGAVIRAVGAAQFDLFGASLGAAVAAVWAAAHPRTISNLLLYGAWSNGREVASAEVREHVLGLVSEHWGLGSDLLTNIFAPDADTITKDAFARYQRGSASAATARSLLALSYDVDVAAVLPQITAPTLVLHRDRDRAVPLTQGREVAELIPGATLAVLTGRAHLPYVGDVDALSAAIRSFLGLSALRSPAIPALTARQLEVAALVADGMTNREIAARLVLTERSVESHVERICIRMGFRSRTQIAAWFAGGGSSRSLNARAEAHA